MKNTNRQASGALWASSVARAAEKASEYQASGQGVRNFRKYSRWAAVLETNRLLERETQREKYAFPESPLDKPQPRDTFRILLEYRPWPLTHFK